MSHEFGERHKKRNLGEQKNMRRENLLLYLVQVTSGASDSLWPHGLLPARLLCPWDFPGKNTGVSCHFLLQGIFPTQGLNLHLIHWQVDTYHWATREAQFCVYIILKCPFKQLSENSERACKSYYLFEFCYYGQRFYHCFQNWMEVWFQENKFFFWDLGTVRYILSFLHSKSGYKFQGGVCKEYRQGPRSKH